MVRSGSGRFVRDLMAYWLAQKDEQELIDYMKTGVNGDGYFIARDNLLQNISNVKQFKTSADSS